SIIGTVFRARIAEETKVGDIPAVVPEITGSAYVTGIHQFVVDPDDPLKEGFLLGMG
ncbi:proline racemase family protein, partial [Candidatus Bipolaricaulota bacterium]|nr:proline racemase family protein [Candidatus Bipolaricaulota bacterium]